MSTMPSQCWAVAVVMQHNLEICFFYTISSNYLTLALNTDLFETGLHLILSLLIIIGKP